MLVEIADVDGCLPAHKAFGLEVVLFDIIDEQEPGRSAGAVRLDLVAVHLGDRTTWFDQLGMDPVARAVALGFLGRVVDPSVVFEP